MKHIVSSPHKYLLLVSLLALLSGCASLQQTTDTAASLEPDITPIIDIYDPFEEFNRGVYRFNAAFDERAFLPVVDAYETITPDFVEAGVSNFFSNIYEVNNLTNAVLQLKPKSSLTTTKRILINSTIGVVGFFDVATKLNIFEQAEDFGQTLGHYGVGAGPYIVLPILGPSNLRDTTGKVADLLTFNSIDLLNLSEHQKRDLAFTLTNSIDSRHQVKFRYYQTGSPFEYELVRLLYNKKRDLDIAR